MVFSLFKKLIGSKNDREIERFSLVVEQINHLEKNIGSLSDADLRAQTAHFKEILASGASIEEILPESFAVVREVSRRVLGMRPFDVQIIGALALHEGKIAEMKTGEGKTLCATMPLYLNALEGKGAHLVTVNDYLARRDAVWMGPIYQFLEMSVGVITHDLNDDERRRAYAADITYGTNNEFGFDYLRDNMKYDIANYSQCGFNYAIVDEVDSILIDEARTPLIISGPTEESTDKYYRINQIIPRLEASKDYLLDEKVRTVSLTEEGIANVERLLKIANLYDPNNIEIIHHINQALRAHTLFKCDVDYVVQDGEVVIVDEFTGRTMPGRRYSDGLHQALEAKERVKVARENQTLASITFQNFFRMYKKLAGMTGTADTEAEEFKKIYNLDVIVVPTNEPMIREDHPDSIYRTQKEKYNAIIKEIKELHRTGRPVLVGTISIEKSELISNMLVRNGIKHHVLNAKHHEREAEIIAQAGQKGAVTISTNMAGRGTDIKLGDGVAQLGGLHILGTERHESRRIDNQLRGRSGRQGDRGSSRFFLSLEDDLLRIFGADRLTGTMERIGMGEGEPIEHKIISRTIESAQKRVEAQNFDIRKHLLEYDNVMNQQRNVIYEQRRHVLTSDDLRSDIEEMLADVAENIVSDSLLQGGKNDELDRGAFLDKVNNVFGLPLLETEIHDLSAKEAEELFTHKFWQEIEAKERRCGKDAMSHLFKMIMLTSIDSFWKEQLLNMDHLREGIGLRGYGQKDPVREYQKEGYEMFVDMVYTIKEDVIRKLAMIKVSEETRLDTPTPTSVSGLIMSRSPHSGKDPMTRGDKVKIGRNQACPCGSGKKYKKCCGK